MDETMMGIEQSADQTRHPAQDRAEMGDFAMPMWDKTQFGLSGVQARIYVDRLLRS
jgi:hypothetical protein